MKHESFNESTEMYLKTVRELGGDEGLAPISALAKRLGVSAVSATEMVHRLQEQGYVEHLPYKGIQLTGDGRERATQVVRSHELWECFLYQHLKLPWAEVHDHACCLEHATDEAVTAALDDFLGHPERCPHGNPIPARDGMATPPAFLPLNVLRPGQQATVEAIFPERHDLLTYLDAQGLLPGQNVVLEEIAPFGGPLMVRVGEKLVALGDEAAQHIFVSPRNGAPS